MDTTHLRRSGLSYVTGPATLAATRNIEARAPHPPPNRPSPAAMPLTPPSATDYFYRRPRKTLTSVVLVQYTLIAGAQGTHRRT
jgi:hypothetical protein